MRALVRGVYDLLPIVRRVAPEGARWIGLHFTMKECGCEYEVLGGCEMRAEVDVGTHMRYDTRGACDASLLIYHGALAARFERL